MRKRRKGDIKKFKVYEFSDIYLFDFSFYLTDSKEWEVLSSFHGGGRKRGEKEEMEACREKVRQEDEKEKRRERKRKRGEKREGKENI